MFDFPPELYETVDIIINVHYLQLHQQLYKRALLSEIHGTVREWSNDIPFWYKDLARPRRKQYKFRELPKWDWWSTYVQHYGYRMPLPSIDELLKGKKIRDENQTPISNMEGRVW
jgi:hypothetical protein